MKVRLLNEYTLTTPTGVEVSAIKSPDSEHFYECVELAYNTIGSDRSGSITLNRSESVAAIRLLARAFDITLGELVNE